MAPLAKFLAAPLAMAGIALAGEMPPPVEVDASLSADDECAADGSEDCTLNALQLRARRAAAAAPAAQEPAAEAYGQCGGQKWTGTTECVAGSTCTEVDQWYSQCIPEGAPAPAPPQQQLEAGPMDSMPSGTMQPLAAQAMIKVPPKSSDGTPPIVIKGNFLYNSKTGKRFFAKGVAYNPRNMVFSPQQMKGGNCTPGTPPVGQLAYAADPTADELESTWKEALDAIADMGANTVRLYNIDPEISHKKFMDYASSIGIYVIVPLTRHDWGYLPAGLPSPKCYTEDIEENSYGNVGTNLLVSAKLIVKQFSQYDNVLMYTVANELTVAEKNGYAAFPCVKALTRDIHRYQQECKTHMRRIPLIYADMDMGPPYREMVGRYMTCELEDPDDAVDAYGLNVYSWCDKEYPDETGENNFKYSPYGPIVDEFKSFAKPLLFTEFGCNLGEFETKCPYEGGRTWDDVPTFFNEFQQIMSGAVAFEFSMEDNQYGITMSPGFVSDKHNAKHFYLLDAYFALKKEFNAHNVSTKWDGAKATSCTWTPEKVHKMSHKHKKQSCPTDDEVQKLFDDKRLDFEPNWATLPPKPKGVTQDALAYCPDTKVDKEAYTEGCCHMKC